MESEFKLDSMYCDAEIDNFAKTSVAIRESTLKRLRLVPAGMENWRVTENSMSFAEIAQHLIDGDLNYCDSLITKRLRPKIPSKTFMVHNREQYEALISELEKTKNIRRQTIGGLSPNEMKESVEIARKSGTSISTVRSVIHTFLNHEAHHRGQLSIYLNILNDEEQHKEAAEVKESFEPEIWYKPSDTDELKF